MGHFIEMLDWFWLEQLLAVIDAQSSMAGYTPAGDSRSLLQLLHALHSTGLHMGLQLPDWPPGLQPALCRSGSIAEKAVLRFSATSAMVSPVESHRVHACLVCLLVPVHEIPPLVTGAEA